MCFIICLGYKVSNWHTHAQKRFIPLKENEIKDVSLVETSHVFRYFGLTTT